MDYCHPGAPGSIPGEGILPLQEQITVLRICFEVLLVESVVLRWRCGFDTWREGRPLMSRRGAWMRCGRDLSGGRKEDRLVGSVRVENGSALKMTAGRHLFGDCGI